MKRVDAKIDTDYVEDFEAMMADRIWSAAKLVNYIVKKYFNEMDRAPINEIKITAPKKETKPGLEWDQIFTDQARKEISHIRKEKKAKLTQRSLNIITKEVKQSLSDGFTMDQVMDIWSDNMWRSFKAEWMRSKATPQNFTMTTQSQVAPAQYNDNARADFNNQLDGLKA